MTSGPKISPKAALAERAKALLPRYREIIAAIPPEAGFGGIWESEMLLFYAAVAPLGPKQILESGRARGKSTALLAACFPQCQIISVEFDRESPNAAAAEAKLRSYSNVQLVYGDSREILPSRVEPGDAVLIDGPKDFRALELAIDLLSTGKPSILFAHDFPAGSIWRKFIEQHWPDAFFGDDPVFDQFGELDQERDPRPPGHGRGYGTFAIFSPALPKRAPQLRFALWLTRLFRRVF
jgi:predicted O-methyltransferase YrrM